MTGFIIELFNLSVKGNFMLLAVLALRLLLKRSAGRRFTCFLWILAGIRLALPFSLESAFSLVPSARTVEPDAVASGIPQIHSGIPAVNAAVNPVLTETFERSVSAGANPMQTLTGVLAAVWLLGFAALVIYGIVSFALLSRRMSDAVRLRGSVYQSEKVSAPFVLGFFRPKIYLPFGLSEEDEKSVTAHENAHIRRGDHLIKPIWFLILAVHWFNPLVWVSYLLLCRDIELACDEKAVLNMNEKERKQYALALVRCSSGKRSLAACPLAFGETGIKERVKSVMKHKKAALGVVLVAVLLSLALAVGFLTDPESPSVRGDFDKSFICLGSRTENPKIELSYGGVDFSNMTLIAYYQNNTFDDMTFGKEFHLYYLDGGKKISCDPKEYYWEEIAYLAPIGISTQVRFPLSGFDLSRVGKYRIETKISVQNQGELNAYLDFELLPADVPRGYYEAEKILYDDASFSSAIYNEEDNMPVFAVDENLVLSDPRTETTLGKLTEIELSADNFDSLFKNSDFRADGFSPRKLRKNSKRAFETVNKFGYYLLTVQNNGEIYLALGFETEEGERVFRYALLISEPEKTVLPPSIPAEEIALASASYMQESVLFESDAHLMGRVKEYAVFFISDDMKLCNNLHEGKDAVKSSWKELGELKKSKKSLKSLLSEKGRWQDGCSAEKIAEENADIWQCAVTNEGKSEYYYIIRQKDGRLLLGYGNGSAIYQLLSLKRADESPKKNIEVYKKDLSDGLWQAVQIEKNSKTFSITASLTSSQLIYGKYTVKGNVLTMKTEDGKHTFVFNSQDGGQSLTVQKSTMPELSPGDKFELRELSSYVDM